MGLGIGMILCMETLFSLVSTANLTAVSHRHTWPRHLSAHKLRWQRGKKKKKEIVVYGREGKENWKKEVKLVLFG